MLVAAVVRRHSLAARGARRPGAFAPGHCMRLCPSTGMAWQTAHAQARTRRGVRPSDRGRAQPLARRRPSTHDGRPSRRSLNSCGMRPATTKPSETVHESISPLSQPVLIEKRRTNTDLEERLTNIHRDRESGTDMHKSEARIDDIDTFVLDKKQTFRR